MSDVSLEGSGTWVGAVDSDAGVGVRMGDGEVAPEVGVCVGVIGAPGSAVDWVRMGAGVWDPSGRRNAGGVSWLLTRLHV